MTAALKDMLRPALRAGYAGFARGAAGLGLRPVDPAPVHFVIEEQDWAIRRVGTGVRDGIEVNHPGRVALVLNAAAARRRVVHFGSQYLWVAWAPFLSRSNRFVTSFFHGKPEDGPDIARHIDAFLASEPHLHRIVASNSLLMDRLRGWGVAPAKLVRIPIGTDTTLFHRPGAAARAAARARYRVPEGHVAIGSFQKDGVGWGDGMEPKPIKGPDLLVAAVESINRERPVHVVLTGPARGYVKAELDRRGISFHHEHLARYEDLVEAYHALDLYLVTSREEGGPMGLMESMASGVPVVSTPVGMGPDLIEHGVTGWLCDIDAGAIAATALAALATPDLEPVLAAAQVAVGVADWRIVAASHWSEVYAPLITELA